MYRVLPAGQRCSLPISNVGSNDVDDCYLALTTVMKETVCFFIGFAVLRVNYRGSTGQGDAAVRCLISNVGSYDVADCYLALTTVLERGNTSNVFLYGKSYGGLIVGHLAAKYSTEFKAVVMKNPLLDLATKGHYADNSDG
ncbi:putative acylpeptide hydrolase [Operophtera brumata]|uniref:Putative acylpeptide hydrolase n=1 Tax=Operophtera brumata TaxID=104452 RepID=A0A0L7LDU8_OPEBR|nr:putative acylpeptide hydrolase [Operophtera brumata]